MSDTEQIIEKAPIHMRKPRTKKEYPPSEELFDQMIDKMKEFKKLQQQITILVQETKKALKKEKRNINNQSTLPKIHKPRGFAQPAPISDELLHFILNDAHVTHITRNDEEGKETVIHIEHGCLIARHEIVTILCNYFMDHKLRKNPKDNREIYLDHTLVNLFKINTDNFIGSISPDNEPIISYFEVQKYIAQHCGKNINSSHISTDATSADVSQ